MAVAKKPAKSKRKSIAGRPTVITPEVSAKLHTAFSVGANIGEACRFGGISHDSFYEPIKKTSDFSGKFEAAKQSVVNSKTLSQGVCHSVGSGLLPVQR
jgi:hypothetical protein